jgi:K+ transporter
MICETLLWAIVLLEIVQYITLVLVADNALKNPFLSILLIRASPG